jgi:very-short-patch-repair endonuclease
MSMSKGGIDRLIDQAQDRLAAQMRALHDHRLSRFPSPIEALFYSSLTAAVRFHAVHPRGEHLMPFLDREKWQDTDFEYLTISAEMQVRVLDWPVDFLLGVSDFSGVKHYAVVECDGHDFHERTKEQAARDRSRDRRLQEAGFRVFRFTGSELYRDPLGCAVEVHRWAETCWDAGLLS